MTALPIWWLPAPRLDAARLLAAAGGEVACALDGARGEWAIGMGAAQHSTAFDLTALAREIAAQPLHPLGAAADHGALWMGAGVFDSARPGGGVWGEAPAARWVLPRVTFMRRAKRLLCAVAGAGDEARAMQHRDAAFNQLAQLARTAEQGHALPQAAAPPQVEWGEAADAFCARVAAAVSAIRRGEMQKVVLARACRVRCAEPIHPGLLLRRMGAAEPDSFLFAMPLPQPGAVLVGASPERLVRVCGGQVQAEALAGSAARAATPKADAAAALALRESKKDWAEHDWVRLFVARALSGAVHASHNLLDAQPGILSTARIHHLHTPFRARRRANFGLPELAARLHPSPAIAGVPTNAALHWLRENEPLARGAYAGPVGWLGRDGEGALAVSLRCAHVQGRVATVFAGAGIVADSDPRAEFEETQLKMRVMLDALGAPA